MLMRTTRLRWARRLYAARAVLGLGSMFVTIDKATLEIAKRRQKYLQASVVHDRSDINRQRISNGNSASEFVSTNRS